jgi:hypothetical protein
VVCNYIIHTRTYIYIYILYVLCIMHYVFMY